MDRRGALPADAHDPSPARPRRPEYTTESMAREVEENPDIARELFADVFVAGFCLECADGPALFATPVYFAPCCRCLAKRMRALLARRDDLPWWVTYLAETCERRVFHGDRRAQRGPTVEFEPFCSCATCGKLIPRKDRRHWFGKNFERSISPPYCVACYHELRAREEG